MLDAAGASWYVCAEVEELVGHGLLTDAERLCRLARAHGEVVDNRDANILAAQLLAEGWA